MIVNNETVMLSKEMQKNTEKCREMLEKFREMQRNVQCAMCVVNVINANHYIPGSVLYVEHSIEDCEK